ncbi:MAG: hypothetical protein QE279_01795 [Rhodoferax sp.]|jgi:hypothetical protein|nr:hypothetical protein [Rhodoferax sp.]
MYRSPSFAVICWRCATGRFTPTETPDALGDIGLSRQSLYKSLFGERAPNSDTLFKLIKALGLS